MTDDLRDELPADLDPSAFVGAYQFPDNNRRRWPLSRQPGVLIWLSPESIRVTMWRCLKAAFRLTERRNWRWLPTARMAFWKGLHTHCRNTYHRASAHLHKWCRR